MTSWTSLGVIAALVAIWYRTDYERARADGRALSPLVHPSRW